MIRKLMILISLCAMLVFSAVVVSADSDTAATPEPKAITGNRAALGNLFQTEYGYEVWLWDPALEQGQHLFTIGYDAVEEAKDRAADTEEAVEVAAESGVTLWALPDGLGQLDSPMVDGPIYNLIFDW